MLTPGNLDHYRQEHEHNHDAQGGDSQQALVQNVVELLAAAGSTGVGDVVQILSSDGFHVISSLLFVVT